VILLHDENIIIERPEIAQAPFSLLRDMRVERGTVDDWEQLHELHYKAEGDVIGRIYRCVLGEQLVGVAIIGSPRLLLAGRHEVFPKLKPAADSRLTNTYRAKFVNANFSVASRIVVDTLFRAGGVSYRMLNLIARMHGKNYMEIQSSMSRFNPFAIKAGFRFVKPRDAAAFEKGLAYMRRYFEAHPADHQGILDELAAMSPAQRGRTIEAMRRFYFKHSALEKTGGGKQAKGTNKLEEAWVRIESYPDTVLMRNLIQLIFASPMYGVYHNPDAGRELPSSLPLLAFDRQPVDKPLILEGL
jgi:hypothetical protein